MACTAASAAAMAGDVALELDDEPAGADEPPGEDEPPAPDAELHAARARMPTATTAPPILPGLT
jgi:hypothetical protein